MVKYTISSLFRLSLARMAVVFVGKARGKCASLMSFSGFFRQLNRIFFFFQESYNNSVTIQIGNIMWNLSVTSTTSFNVQTRELLTVIGTPLF